MKKGTVSQLYYTSCRRGLSGYAGFQTRAESDEIQLQERREIETKALYHPPSDLPRTPDTETILSQFPKAFKVVRLSSGNLVFIRSVYIGQDYSERWGNYFVHTLMLHGETNGLWTIDFYGWSRWVSGLVDGEDDTDPKPLPVISLDEIDVGTAFSFEKLSTFLSEDKKRTEILSKMLCAIFQRSTDSRNIVIREHSETNGAYWIACVQKAFPLACQEELTISTFQFDPRNTMAINATMGETNFLFDERERKYQFYVFDFVAEENSEVNEEYMKYAMAISKMMSANSPPIDDFHEFATQFNIHEIGLPLLHIFRLYQMKNRDNISLTATELNDILKFVNEYVQSDTFENMLEILGDVTRYLTSDTSPEDWRVVIEFLIPVATNQPKYRQSVCDAWVNAFDHFVIKEQHSENVVMELRDEIDQAFMSKDDKMLAETFLDDNHFDLMLKHVGEMRKKNLKRLITEVNKSCLLLDSKPTYEAPAVTSLIEAVIYRSPIQPPDFGWVFDAYRSNVEGLSSVLTHILTTLKGQESNTDWKTTFRAVGRSLSTSFGTNNDEIRFKLINNLRMNDTRFADIIFGEWEASINQAIDKIKAHTSYENNIFSDDSEFVKSMRNKMAEALLKTLPIKEQRRLARNWVKSESFQHFSEEIAIVILETASENINLAEKNRALAELVNLISAKLKERKLTLNLPRLQWGTATLHVLSPDKQINSIQKIIKDESYTDKSYTEFLKIVLSTLLLRTKSLDGYREVILSLTLLPHIDVFKKVYIEFLQQQPRDNFKPVNAYTIMFLLQRKENGPEWDKLRTSAVAVMKKRLGAMHRKKRSSAGDYLKKEFKLKLPQLSKNLDKFLEDVNTTTPSLLSRIMAPFIKKR